MSGTSPRYADSSSLIVEQAKGVLMLRYGVSSYEALGVLARWSRESAEPVREIARALTHGVCQGRRQDAAPSRWLVRWLEQRLRSEISEHAGAD